MFIVASLRNTAVSRIVPGAEPKPTVVGSLVLARLWGENSRPSGGQDC